MPDSPSGRRGLWALGHPADIGGVGVPFMPFVYMNEIIGRSHYGSVAIGSASMQDSIMLNLYASDEQRADYEAALERRKQASAESQEAYLRGGSMIEYDSNRPITSDQVRIDGPGTLEIADYAPFRFDLE